MLRGTPKSRQTRAFGNAWRATSRSTVARFRPKGRFAKPPYGSRCPSRAQSRNRRQRNQGSNDGRRNGRRPSSSMCSRARSQSRKHAGNTASPRASTASGPTSSCAAESKRSRSTRRASKLSTAPRSNGFRPRSASSGSAWVTLLANISLIG